MSLNDLERAIVSAANLQHDRSYKLKDLMEWSSAEIKAQDGEETFAVKGYGYATFKLPVKKHAKQ